MNEEEPWLLWLRYALACLEGAHLILFKELEQKHNFGVEIVLSRLLGAIGHLERRHL
jgi:hypothetical protein